MSDGPIVIIMGQDCEQYLRICLESVKDAKKIIYIDGGTTKDMSVRVAMEYKAEVFVHQFVKSDVLANSKQRQFYLEEILKKRFMGELVLVLDADEFVEDFSKIQAQCQVGEFTNEKERDMLCSVKMRHFIGNFAYEDATQKEHFVPNRLFRVSESVFYPDGEHTVLQSKQQLPMVFRSTASTIWHLAYSGNMFDVKKRYENHVLKSEVHSKDYLEKWYRAHLFGQYPVSSIKLEDLPEILLKAFHIDKDEIYFANRGLEVKHFIDAKHWKDYFKCESAIEWGCGRGPRLFALATLDVKCAGMEISEWAIQNPVVKTVGIGLGDITEKLKGITLHNDEDNSDKLFDLSIAYDVLEHIPYDKLSIAIDNLIVSTGKHILVSVPVIGDPNLENDKTHIIKETKEWWLKQFTDKGLKHITTPDHFLFKDQVMIFEKVQNAESN